MKCQKLSVVMPAYNEGSNIYKNLKMASDCLRDFCEDYELVAVNDGSKDCTKMKLSAQHQKIIT